MRKIIMFSFMVAGLFLANDASGQSLNQVTYEVNANDKMERRAEINNVTVIPNRLQGNSTSTIIQRSTTNAVSPATLRALNARRTQRTARTTGGN